MIAKKDATKENRKNKGQGIVVFIVLIVLAALAGGAYYYWNAIIAHPAAARQASTYQTTSVTRGDLSASVSGPGTLAAGTSLQLGFTVSGKIAQMNVQVGETVKAGQTLAALDTTALELNIKNQQLAVQQAQNTLDTLTVNAAQTLAQAAADKAAAEQALANAQKNLHSKGDPRCDPSLTEEYYFQYLKAQEAANVWQRELGNPNTGYGKDYILQNLNPLKRKVELANDNYVWCQGYTDQEIAASHANLDAAQVKLQQTTAAYTLLSANQGVNPDDLKIDQAALESAKQQLNNAQQALAGATITAPFDGTVTAVNGIVGQDSVISASTNGSAATGTSSTTGVNSSATSAYVTVADLNHPLIQVNVDETDLDSFTANCAAQVAFNGIPGKSYAGTVTDVGPQLVSVQGASTMVATVTLKSGLPDGQVLPVGAGSIVHFTCSSAQNVLNIPLIALHQPASGNDYVYVLNAFGSPEKRSVEIGAKTTSLVEIRSGLAAGERVITSPSLP